MKKIVIVTDCTDVAANEIYGTLREYIDLSPLKDTVRIEPVVPAPNFSVTSGTFLVRLMAEVYEPRSTIFLVILNSLKTNRKERARIIGRTKNGFTFIGANTGTLGWLIKDFGIDVVYESSKKGLDGEDFISFGGKTVHAPICAKIATGTPLEKLGSVFNPQDLVYPKFKEGQVLYIDNFGVVKFFGVLPQNFQKGQRFRLTINGKVQCVGLFTDSMKNLPDDTWAIYKGSSLNLYELGLVRNHGASQLKIKVDDILLIELI